MERGWDWEKRPGGAPGGRAASGEAVREEDAVEWARARLGFEADAKQAVVLRSGRRRGILNCSRQWGKSTVTAVKAVHFAMHEAESLTIVVSRSERQSRELVRKAAGFVRKLGVKAKGAGGGDLSLVLPNRSRMVALPGSEATVRGFSAVGLLIIDEASRVSDELYRAVRPMLAVSNGALWMMSTPFGRRGFFYEEWAHGGEEWQRVEAPATECPRISREFLAGEEKAMGRRWFQQEYLCAFDDAETSVFDSKMVERAFSGDFGALEV